MGARNQCCPWSPRKCNGFDGATYGGSFSSVAWPVFMKIGRRGRCLMARCRMAPHGWSKRPYPCYRQPKADHGESRQCKSWHRECEQGRDLQVGYTRSMFKCSNEQRQVAVQHYLDHDRCIASTMKVLGYPCRETLTVWVDELHPEVQQRIGGGAPSVQHVLELKNAAVIALCTKTTTRRSVHAQMPSW